MLNVVVIVCGVCVCVCVCDIDRKVISVCRSTSHMMLVVQLTECVMENSGCRLYIGYFDICLLNLYTYLCLHW